MPAQERQMARGRDAAERPFLPAGEVSAAFDCLRIALAVFDRSDRLIYANEHFRYLYRSFDAVAELIGMTFEEIMRLIVANGEIAGETAATDPAAWVAERLQEHRSHPFHAFDQRLSDGRYLQIKERPTRDGGSVLVWIDVTDMMRQRIRLEDAMRSASEGFALWNQADRLVGCTERFARLFGDEEQKLRPGVVYARMIRAAVESGRLVPPGDPAAWVADRLASRRLTMSRTEIHARDGRWFQLAECRTRDGGMASVLSDITVLKESELELRRRGKSLERTVHELEMVQVKTEEQAAMLAAMAEELDGARRDAERANAYKTAFLRSITHELRTPLNAIIGFSEFLQSEALGKLGSPKYAEYVEIIRASGMHLLSLINQLLDLSRIEAGRLELKRDIHDLGDILRYCVAMVRESAARGGLKLAIHIPEEPVAVDVDLLATRQVVLNLLSNAIKFTEPGGTVALHTAIDGAMVKVAVADTGVGIADEDLPRLMQPFTQAGDVMTRRAQGSGLGLAIARALTELHGGRIALESRLGVGTTVSATLPLAPDPVEQAVA
ncbi:MAG: PAS-domain containing protein [Alphaproteobacteria bacterium]|nr:PAS-domain containing protein [Alphaproteobacteria bacterium]